MRSVAIVGTGWTSIPGVSIGTKNMVRPLCLGTSGLVRVSRITQSASWAMVVHIFWPLITQPSPSRAALVVMAAKSEPWSGSL